MKLILSFLLCASLAANAALLVRSLNVSARDPLPADGSSKDDSREFNDHRSAKKIDADSSAQGRHDSEPSSHPWRGITDDIWQKAVAGDAAALQAIRDSGLPPDLWRALIKAVVNERFAARERAFYKSPSELKYWGSTYDRARYTPKDRIGALDLRREKGAVLDQLIPGWRDEGSAVDVNRAFLSAEKSQRLSMLEEDYSTMMSNVRGDNSFGSSIIIPADREKLKYLEQERRTELAQILSPEELEEYSIRKSNTASMLRYQLSAFGPTEQEFRSILPIQKTLVDDKYSFSYGPMTAEDRAARTKAQEQADAQIKTLLGDQRYEEYVRAKDYEYRTLSEITDHYQLPKDRAIDAYKLKTSLEQKFQSVMKDSTPETRTQLLTAVKDEADREFPRLLGTKGYEVYKQNSNLAQRVEAILAVPTPPPSKPKG